MPEEVEGSLAVSEVGGVADGFGDEVFGARTASTGVSPRTRWQRRAEEKAQPVPWVEVESRCSPANLWKSPEGRRRRSVGWAWSPAVATMWRWGCRAARMLGGGFGLGEGFDGLGGEGGELGPVGCDPGHKGEELVVEGLDGVGWEEVGAGAGAEDGVEDNGGLEGE